MGFFIDTRYLSFVQNAWMSMCVCVHCKIYDAIRKVFHSIQFNLHVQSTLSYSKHFDAEEAKVKRIIFRKSRKKEKKCAALPLIQWVFGSFED